MITFALLGKLNAQVINLDDAQNIAQKSFAEIHSISAKSVSLNENYYVKTSNSLPVAYIFTESNGGFVIISGEERTIPVLAYSPEGTFDLDESNWPENFAYWMQTYCEQIELIRENNLPASSESVDMRSKIDNNIDFGFTPTKDVAPLLATTWNQGCGYNADCPSDGSGPCGHVYTGCVATAMAQVFRYMEHPVTGISDKCYTHYTYGEQCADFSSTTYDYASMPNGSGNAEVAELMYHCGVSVSMNYSPTGSGAYSNNVPTAYKNYFDYKNAIIVSKSSYSDDAWHSILKNEIDNSRPMYYSGSGSGGHAFVCDGYQATNHFHFNWGWGGSYNGYFYCDALTPGSHNYTGSQRAVIGAIPSPLFTNLDFSGALELNCASPLNQDLATGNNHINYYNTTYPACPGKELTYYFTTTLPGRIRIKIDNVSDGYLRAILLSHPHQDSVITYGTNGFIIDDTGAGTYYLSIESTSGQEPTFDIEVICPTIDAELFISNGQVNPQYLTSLQTNVQFTSTVKNIGNTDAAANTINYYLSDDMVYDLGIDTFLGTDVVPALTIGSTTNISTSLTMPAGLTPGNKNVIFIVDETNIVPEADDQNEFFGWAEVPTPGLLDCTSSVSLTDGIWYYDNTETSGTNNVEAHWAAWDCTAPEIIHSFIPTYNGVATISFTEKIAGEMHCMVYPICNENTWLASTWFAEMTDTLATENFYVTAGTEYFVVVDSKLPIQGEYGVKIDLPQECPELLIEYWGELDLCDGDPYPNFNVQWGHPNYQWYRDGIAIPNQTWSNYNPDQPGEYYVMVEENSCVSYSDSLTIATSPAPDTATIVSLGPIQFCSGGSVDLQLNNLIVSPYQWAKDGELIPGETSNILNVTESGNYSIVTTNSSCSVESDTIIEVTAFNNPIDLGDNTPFPSDSIEFYVTFDEHNNDIINNYFFNCWDFIPTDDRDGNFWQARDFSTGDYLGYVSNYREIPDEFTLSLWFNTTTTEGGVIASFVNNPWSTTLQDAVLYMSDDGKLHYYMSDGGTPQELISTNSYNDGNWHNILFTHSLGIMMEIDNTVEHLSIATAVTHQTFDGYWCFAGPQIPVDVTNMPTSQYFDGIIDDILCLNESKYSIRNYIDDEPQLEVYFTSGSTDICDSGLDYFTIKNSELGIEYQLWDNTHSSFYPITETGTGSILSLGGNLITETTEYMFLATNPDTGCETWLDTTITITVLPSLTPIVSISSDGIDPICQGTEINFTATVTDAGTSPYIQWYYNGTAIGPSSTTFSYSSFTDTDTVYAEVLSFYACSSPDTVLSNEIIHTVLPITTPSVSIINTPGTIICPGENVIFVAIPVDSGISPSYQWFRDGNPVGTNSSSYSASDFNDGEEVYVIVTSDYACSTSPTEESNHITISVEVPPTADYTILSGGYCFGEEICFEYSGDTAGLDHVEWEVIDGGPSTSFSGEGPHCYTPTSTVIDIIVSAYNSTGCSDTAWFLNPMLSPSLVPSVTISTDETATYCEDFDLVEFIASTTNCGINPIYQWYVNGVAAGTNSDTFSSFHFDNNDEIYCIVTNSLSCASSSTAESNHININITERPEAIATITGGTCSDEELCFQYDGSMVDIVSVQWEVWEEGVQTIYSGIGPHCLNPTTNNPLLVLELVNTNGCWDTLPNSINMYDTPTLTLPDTVYKCADSWTSISEAEGHSIYEWSNGDNDYVTSVPDEGTYYLTVTNENGCQSIDSTLVINYSGEDIDLISDTTVCMDETVILEFNNSYVYDNIIWSDGHTGTIWDEDTPEIGYTGNNPQFIYVEAYTEHCTFEDTIYIHYDICESINSKVKDLINIYPNPASEILIVESDNPIGCVIVYDITGKILYEEKTNKNSVRIDISSYSKAAYYVKIITIKGEVLKTGFMKI